MSSDAWPSPDSPPAPLPRLEDLPLAENGYDQEAVRVAFDAFYRHAAQLDASLRALEAVEVFRRDADALRNDLRALRSLAVGTGGSEPAWAARSDERQRSDVPAVVFRLAAESALIVAVAVIAGISHLRPVVIVALMAGAFVIVAISEWLAARSRFVSPAVALWSPREGEAAPYVHVAAPAWGQQGLAAAEDTEPDALTIVEAPAEPAVDPWEQSTPEDEGEAADEDEEAADDPADGGEPELAERGGIFRRRRR